MDAFGTVQFPPEVDPVRPVYLLDLDYRQPFLAEDVQDPLPVANAVPSGIVPIALVHLDEVFLLNVNYQQGTILL